MAPTISSITPYYLVNQFSGFILSIDSTEDDYRLRASGDGKDTSVKFLFTITDAGKYNICSKINTTQYCLDVLGSDVTVPHLAPSSQVSGQQWTLASSGADFRFSNDDTGDGYFLDVDSITKRAFMSSGDDLGHSWTLDPASEHTFAKSSLSSSLSPTATPGHIPWATVGPAVITSSVSASPTAPPPAHAACDTVCKVGLAAGLGGFAAIAIGVAIVWRTCRKHRQK